MDPITPRNDSNNEKNIPSFSPDAAGVAGQQGATPAGPPKGIPSGPPAGVAGSPSGIPAGPPPGVVAGPPSGVPAGTPKGIPGGPPAGIAGPPNGIPAGPPAGVAGPPAGVAGPVGGPPSGVGGPPPGAIGAPPGPDPTTGALNMPAFAQEYAKTVMSGKYEQLALWYIDIRNFRSVNPKFGFLQGNLVLKTLVNNLKEILAHELPIARLGADRFVPLTAGFDYEEAKRRFEQVIKKSEEDLAKQGIYHTLVLIAGVYYLRPEDYGTPSFQKPLDYVSIAHRNAREESHSNVTQFTDKDLEIDSRRITIEQSIDEALETGQIQVWYQPQIDYIYGEVVGAEALARWNHPDLGWISPAEFIPVLENCGKVHQLDLFVWEEACRSAGRWRSVSDGKPVPISVNVSRAEMFEAGLMEHFLELQQKYDLPKGSLHLEVTESAFVEEANRLYKVIEEMRAKSLLVEMDDFGSGLSSLNMLKDVPVDVVKLDMGFMRSAMNEDRGGVVLGAAIRMLQGLDTPIIAEGVETLEQAEMLKNMGCHLMQGFHFSHPMPIDDFESFMASNRAVEKTEHRERQNSHLDELTSVDTASSFLFNNVMGGTMFFFAGAGTSESILVNDQFYAECGLNRADFGNTKVNPIKEIDPESRATLWRAAAEAREYGAATCRAKVRITGRWIECVMRFLGTSSRGDVYSLNIIRSGEMTQHHGTQVQIGQDVMWDVDMLESIVPNGFVKCDTSDSLIFNYVSPSISECSGLSESEFVRRFHNSLVEAILPEYRVDLLEAVRESKVSGKSFSLDLKAHHGYSSNQRNLHVIGRVKQDDGGQSWLYLLVLLLGDVVSGDGAAQESTSHRVITFDYDLSTDKLTVQDPTPDDPNHQIVYENWLAKLEHMPESIAQSSATKVLATVRDLRHHPAAGFSDIKCNLRGGDELRWYHINYTCDANEDGNTTILHGYAQDANDQMGSVRWWRAQAETDQLTGLLNRNAAEQGINMSMRTQGSGMMFMIDLDGFKRVNDDLGHLTGDALLRDVAEALNSKFREGDVLGRYGGDEFVAFMPVVMGGDPRKLAARRSQAIIDAISTIDVGDGTHAACSVGVALSNDRGATFYDLLEVADEALYMSKEAGKGRFTILDAE